MELKFNKDGLIPVITQDFETKEVLMHAYMNKEAYDKTIETKKVHYYSRSRQQLWLKGETSGHFQLVKNIYIDCDNDTLLILVEQIEAACHTGHKSCFYTSVLTDGEASDRAFENILNTLYGVILNRRDNPTEGSYTNYLFDKGIDKILKKVGEETSEVIIASKNDDKSEIIYEISDLIYHLSVLMALRGVYWDDIYSELRSRHMK